LLSEVNCSIAIFESVSASLKSLKECSNKTAANASEHIYQRMFQNLTYTPQMFGCPLPCLRIIYERKVFYFHENFIGSEIPESNFSLIIYPSSSIIEDQVKLCCSALYLLLRLAFKVCVGYSSLCQI
jgi:hypothetical protein